MTQVKEGPDAKAIKKLIQAFFDAINAADSKALASHFVPGAILTILREDPPLPPSDERYPQYAALPKPNATTSVSRDNESVTVVIRTTIEKFVVLIEEGKKKREREGKPDLNIFEQPDLGATNVQVDTLFGMAWSPFKVTFDGVLHHYGTIVYTVTRVQADNGEREWKIDTLSQNYRRAPGWEQQSDFV